MNSRCSWAYYIGEISIRGKGIAGILECNVYDFALLSMNLNKLWCEVPAFNDRVVEIHKRYGSKFEGVLRERIIKNGQKHDVVRMSILREEWLVLRQNIEYEKTFIEGFNEEMLNYPQKKDKIPLRGGSSLRKLNRIISKDRTLPLPDYLRSKVA